DRARRVVTLDLEQSDDCAGLRFEHQLAAGYSGEAAQRVEVAPRALRLERIDVGARPAAEIDLGKRIARFNRRAACCGNDVGCLARAIERAGIDGGDGLAGEVCGEVTRLHESIIAQADAGRAADEFPADATECSMTDEVQSRHATRRLR